MHNRASRPALASICTTSAKACAMAVIGLDSNRIDPEKRAAAMPAIASAGDRARS